MYQYKCKINRIIDGDTVDIDIDLGFDTWINNQRVRFIGIDAPEVRTKDLEEKAAGLAVKAFVSEMLPLESTQVLLSKEYNADKGKYGRIIGDFLVWDIKTDSQRKLTEIMLRENLVELYE